MAGVAESHGREKESEILVSAVATLFNEEEGVETFTRNLHSAFLERFAGCPFEIVLVLNGSLDGTPEIAGRLADELKEVKTVSLDTNQGYGGGILAGLEAARGEVVGFVDGDEQVDATEVAYVFQEAVNSSHDLVKAKRVARQDGAARMLISLGFNTLFRAMFGGRTGDINAKPKVFKKEALDRLKLSSTDWFLDSEIMIKARREGMSVGEVPVIFQKRAHGSSNVDASTLVEFLKNMWAYRNG